MLLLSNNFYNIKNIFDLKKIQNKILLILRRIKFPIKTQLLFGYFPFVVTFLYIIFVAQMWKYPFIGITMFFFIISTVIVWIFPFYAHPITML
jgi:hypothetical protein